MVGNANVADKFKVVGLEVFTVMTIKQSSSVMWCHVGLVRRNISEEQVASIFRI
jgi:hypothetical protein